MNKVIVVTGAGGVLCSGFAEFLASKGAKVALLDLNEEAAQKVAEGIIAKGGIAKAYKCNCLDKADIEAVHQKVLADFGKCDILVNGAGGNNPRCTTAHEEYVAGDETAEEMDKLYEQVEEFYNKVKGKETTPEEFKAVFSDTNYGWYETAARGDDFYFEVANWILDPERKKGDMEMFADSQDGIFVVYYLEPNPEDLDWKHYVRTILSDERYVAEYEELSDNYELKEDSKVISKVMTETDARIKKSIEEEKTAQNQQ